MTHKAAPPETETQRQCREWWAAREPHVSRAWGRAKDGNYLAENSRNLHAAWAAARQPSCGTCGETIRPDALTGTTCACTPSRADAAVSSWIADPDTIPAALISAAHDAIQREFGNTGTDGYYKRILVKIFVAFKSENSDDN